MSPTPPAGSLFRRAPIPLTEMMYRFRAPELSAQFMMAPLCDPCQLPSLPQICGVWLEVVLAQSDCRTVGRTYTGRPRVILSLPPGAPRLRKHHCQPNGSPPILLVFWASPGPSLLVVQLQASRCFDSCAAGVSRLLSCVAQFSPIQVKISAWSLCAARLHPAKLESALSWSRLGRSRSHSRDLGHFELLGGW